MSDELDLEDDQVDSNKKSDSETLAIQNLMRTEPARDFIWGYLQSCSVFESIFNTDPVKAGYNSGMRDAGLILQRKIKEAAPADYMKMIKENING